MYRGNNDGNFVLEIEEQQKIGKTISYLFYVMPIWLTMYFLPTVFLKKIASILDLPQPMAYKLGWTFEVSIDSSF